MAIAINHSKRSRVDDDLSAIFEPGVNLTFNMIAKKYKMPTRIPPALYSDILSENDLVIVILEHIDYLLKLEGKKSPYGFAAYSISQLKEPLSAMKGELRKIKGVGRTTEVVIREIQETGSSGYYEKMLQGGNERTVGRWEMGDKKGDGMEV